MGKPGQAESYPDQYQDVKTDRADQTVPKHSFHLNGPLKRIPRSQHKCLTGHGISLVYFI